MASKGRSGIRALNRRSTSTGRLKPAEVRTGRGDEPVLCERCGATFAKRIWRRTPAERPPGVQLAAVEWRTCPACMQVEHEEWLGRVVLRGPLSTEQEAAIRKRMRNVAARAEFTQPERRIVSIERVRDKLEVLTTSQKLAHRIGHELQKAFGGRTRYAWLDDGALEARWTPEPDPAAKAAVRTPSTRAVAKGAQKPARKAIATAAAPLSRARSSRKGRRRAAPRN